MSIDKIIDEKFAPISEFLVNLVFYSVPVMGHNVKLVLLFLVVIALFLTFYLGFINFRYFGHAIDLLRGKHDEPHAKGEVNNFQALSTCLASTVGLGNIAGVAVAVSVGGPGAVFWMAFMGLFGMSTKFAEAALGVKYRHIIHVDGDDQVNGGPMHYIRAAFEKVGMGGFGKGMALFCAACFMLTTLGAGNMFQANQTFQQFVNVTGGEASFLADKGWLFGLVLAGLVGVVIIGGLQSIAKVSAAIVPVMGILYILSGLAVMIFHIQDLPEAVVIIVKNAFIPEAGLGAFIGALLMGVQRAVFSNEAGLGTAAVIHAAARTEKPISQGFVAMLGPFVDTVVICMVTAFVIVLTGAYEGGQGMEGVELTSRAFASVIPWFPYLLTFIVFLFAYSTQIGYSYYGLVCTKYLFGQKKSVDLTYKIIFLLATVVGTSASLGSVIDFTDATIFAMAIPNVIALFMLAPELKKDLKVYLQDIHKK